LGLWKNGSQPFAYVMDHYDSNGFRSNVGIILTREDRSLLLGGRTGQAGWQFPQGGMQINESPLEAMYRELQEELGLCQGDIEVIGQTSGWLHYRLPERYVRRDRIPLCIGQRQRWFLLRLEASEEALNLGFTDTPEFDRWRWVDYFKRQVYVHALAELAPLLFADQIPPQPNWWPRDWLTEPYRPA
jgi:putative (di)nucleoside polyphosphate hydrolase